ncbi:hypothetical protein LCGC14_2910360, partial [marine sediment metagenome]
MLTAVSFSRVQLFDACKLAYKLRHIDKVPEPKSAPLIGGSLFHAWAEKYVAHLIETKRQTDLEMAQELSKDQTVIKETIPFEVLEDIQALFLKWVESFVLPGVPVKVEQELALDRDFVPCNWFDKATLIRAKIDRVEQPPGAELVIHDYKTSRALPEYKPLQGKTYAYMKNVDL